MLYKSNVLCDILFFFFFYRTTKFYGNANLGNIIKKDGIIYGYSDTEFSINGDNSKVCLSLHCV